MRIVNTETPTFAGNAGVAGKPAVVEELAFVDRGGIKVGSITKDVAGITSLQVGAFTAPATVPELPAEAELQDVIDALLEMGLVTVAPED